MLNKSYKFLIVTCFWLASIFLFSEQVLAISASGSWRAEHVANQSDQSGSINLEFPAEGGSATGTFSGGSNQMEFGGKFTGSFTGGPEGSFSGNFTGWWQARNLNEEMINGGIHGSWQGQLHSDGSISANFQNKQKPYPLSGVARLSYPVDQFAKEYETAMKKEKPEEDEDFSDDSTAEDSDQSWVADVGDAYEAYVTYNGERTPIESYKNFSLKPGMVIETEGELGEIIIQLEDGGQLWLGGDGSRVEILSADIFTPEQQNQLTDGDSLNSPVALQSGHMIVEYEAAGKTGSWFTGMEDGQASDDKNESFVFLTSPISKGMDLTVFNEAIGTISSLRDSGSRTSRLSEETDAPEKDGATVWGMFFGNKSKVEYELDDKAMKINISVHEGEVGVYQLDPATSQTNKVKSAKTGDAISVDFPLYAQTKGQKGVSIDSFDLQAENKELESFETLKDALAQKKNMKNFYIGGAIGVAILGIILFLIKNRK